MENKKILKLYKVYGIAVEIQDRLFLSVQYAPSLEDAYRQAKLEFINVNKTDPFGAKIILFNAKTLTALEEENTKFKENTESAFKLMSDKKDEQEGIPYPKETINSETKETTEKEKKNILMAKIIQLKDEKLFEVYKSQFSIPEQKYIRERIKKDVKN